ncbi:hypothetical protein PXJ20_08750 [Paraburkholderia sp. A1RI_3L]|uniref:hypothetical protein n=1 Tax=Paraburkholderia sp. A1RI_3L TaxID=3029269 RepID=UPI003B7674D0
MNNKAVDQDCHTLTWQVAVAVASMVGLLVAAPACAAGARDDADAAKWAVSAHVPLPASVTAAAIFLAQDTAAGMGAATNAEASADAITAAEDAATVFLPRECDRNVSGAGSTAACNPSSAHSANGGRGAGGAGGASGGVGGSAAGSSASGSSGGLGSAAAAAGGKASGSGSKHMISKKD